MCNSIHFSAKLNRESNFIVFPSPPASHLCQNNGSQQKYFLGLCIYIKQNIIPSAIALKTIQQNNIVKALDLVKLIRGQQILQPNHDTAAEER